MLKDHVPHLHINQQVFGFQVIGRIKSIKHLCGPTFPHFYDTIPIYYVAHVFLNIYSDMDSGVD